MATVTPNVIPSQSRPTLAAGSVHLSVCPSHSCEHNNPGTHRGNFFKFGTNAQSGQTQTERGTVTIFHIRLDSELATLTLGAARLNMCVKHPHYRMCCFFAETSIVDAV